MYRVDFHPDAKGRWLYWIYSAATGQLICTTVDSAVVDALLARAGQQVPL